MPIVYDAHIPGLTAEHYQISCRAMFDGGHLTRESPVWPQSALSHVTYIDAETDTGIVSEAWKDGHPEEIAKFYVSKAKILETFPIPAPSGVSMGVMVSFVAQDIKGHEQRESDYAYRLVRLLLPKGTPRDERSIAAQSLGRSPTAYWSYTIDEEMQVYSVWPSEDAALRFLEMADLPMVSSIGLFVPVGMAFAASRFIPS